MLESFSDLAAISDICYPLRLRKNVNRDNSNSIVVALNTNKLVKKTTACKIIGGREKFSNHFSG